MAGDPNCIFCKIAAGEIPARVAYQNDELLAFHDINPAAPTHILIIPREHIASANEINDQNVALVGRILQKAAELAHEQGIAQEGYRIVTNIGDNGGQSVHHLHVHVLGGRKLAWPPG